MMVNGFLMVTPLVASCNSVSWVPATQLGSLIHPQQPGAQPTVPFKHFASGCDNLVKIWGYREDTQSWVEEEMTLDGYTETIL
jgi:protein transport protein SEC13